MYWLVHYSSPPLACTTTDLEGGEAKENRAFRELEAITFRSFHVSRMIRMIDALVE